MPEKRPASQDDPLANSDSDTETAGPSTQALPSTPRRRGQSAPAASSPISVMNPTPVRRGRPMKKARKSGPATEPRLSAADLEQQQRLRQEQQEQRQREMEAEKQQLREQARQLREETKEQEKTRNAKALLDVMKKDTADGGYGFKTFNEFMTALMDSKDQQLSASMSRFSNKHGGALIEALARRAPDIAVDAAVDTLAETLQKEGKAVKEIFSRGFYTSVSELLKTFSMETLSQKLQEAAPTIWKLLTEMSLPLYKRQKKNQRDENLIFTTMCAMMGILQSTRATDFHITLGLFLLGSGASKREIEVLAHAGICISYSAILKHVRRLSEEGTRKFKEAIGESACMIVWDNLNIAFRVGEQRLQSKDHFDNGTTSTLIPLYDPDTNGPVPHGTLPFDLKPERTTRRQVFEFPVSHVLPSPEAAEQLSSSCLWQLKRIAMETIPALACFRDGVGDCPIIILIPVHKTKQYPLPAHKIDESSIDGTIEVLIAILKDLGVDTGFMIKHGLLFVDGDLLTQSLLDKVEAARRNSTDVEESIRFVVQRFGLFHCKMAGGRMVVNEHWGKPNGEFPGGLWWENSFLQRKAMVAGWKSKKAAPWKQAHDLLQISLAAHVKDAFRIHCGQDSLDKWAQSTTLEDFNHVSQSVFDNLFSTQAVDKLRQLPQADRDLTHENAILFNRDALFYIEFVMAINPGRNLEYLQHLSDR